MTLEETPLDGPVADALEDYRTASEEAQAAFDEYQDKSAASEAAWDKLVNLVRARHLLATGESITPSEAHGVISAALNPSEPEEGEPTPEVEEPESEEGEEPPVEEPEPEPETDE